MYTSSSGHSHSIVAYIVIALFFWLCKVVLVRECDVSILLEELDVGQLPFLLPFVTVANLQFELELLVLLHSDSNESLRFIFTNKRLVVCFRQIDLLKKKGPFAMKNNTQFELLQYHASFFLDQALSVDLVTVGKVVPAMRVSL